MAQYDILTLELLRFCAVDVNGDSLCCCEVGVKCDVVGADVVVLCQIT